MLTNQVVESEIVFSALSSRTRRKILQQIVKNKLTILELASKNKVTKQAISKHIDILVKSGFVVKEKVGREKYCLFDPKPLNEIKKYVEELEIFWEDRLNSLKNIIENNE